MSAPEMSAGSAHGLRVDCRRSATMPRQPQVLMRVAQHLSDSGGYRGDIIGARPERCAGRFPSQPTLQSEWHPGGDAGRRSYASARSNPTFSPLHGWTSAMLRRSPPAPQTGRRWVFPIAARCGVPTSCGPSLGTDGHLSLALATGCRRLTITVGSGRLGAACYSRGTRRCCA
jgi:hypothetical protein